MEETEKAADDVAAAAAAAATAPAVSVDTAAAAAEPAAPTVVDDQEDEEEDSEDDEPESPVKATASSNEDDGEPVPVAAEATATTPTAEANTAAVAVAVAVPGAETVAVKKKKKVKKADGGGASNDGTVKKKKKTKKAAKESDVATAAAVTAGEPTMEKRKSKKRASDLTAASLDLQAAHSDKKVEEVEPEKKVEETEPAQEVEPAQSLSSGIALPISLAETTVPAIEEPTKPVVQEAKPVVEEETPAQKAQSIFNGTMNRKDVAPFIGRDKEHNKAVLKAFVDLFDFKGKRLDVAVRLFCDKFPLLAEAQVVARILDQFAVHYQEQNPTIFKSPEVVHTVVTSMMLLNTDLHSGAVDKKMSASDFVKNTFMALEESERPPDGLLKEFYASVKRSEIPLGDDDSDALSIRSHNSSAISFFFGSSSSREVSTTSLSSRSSSNDGPQQDVSQLYCEGIVMKKAVMETADKKASSRSWKPVEAVLRQSGLHLYRIDSTHKVPKEKRHLEAVSVLHVVASTMRGHPERPYVFSVLASNGGLVYFECNDETTMNNWVYAINWVAATMSAPPLPGAIGSQTVFRRPVLPQGTTSLALADQLAHHKKKIDEFDKKIIDHIEYQQDLLEKHSGRGSKALQAMANWDNEMNYLNGERQKYDTYVQVINEGSPLEHVLSTGATTTKGTKAGGALKGFITST